MTTGRWVPFGSLLPLPRPGGTSEVPGRHVIVGKKIIIKNKRVKEGRTTVRTKTSTSPFRTRPEPTCREPWCLGGGLTPMSYMGLTFGVGTPNPSGDSTRRLDSVM